MLLILLLILLGLLFLVAELVLLPGISIGGILALICDGCAIYIAFREGGPSAGSLVIAAILLLSLVTTILALRRKTWQRFSLHQKIESSSMPDPERQGVSLGDEGTALSRLAPMGKVSIGGRIYEAKSLDSYIDPRSSVEVVGFENFNIIVRKKQMSNQ
ncbi:MAG: NfeD family protein [Alistipes sp.]|nr:NfeD family protein [Alistipes sp.]